MNDTLLHASPVPVRAWAAIFALGISAFSIVTSELAPVGMLSALAKDLHQTESGAGLVVTIYGWVGALTALVAGAMPARIPRKALLVGLMLILAFSCLAATLSHSMTLFMIARMAGAIAHGAFWAFIGVVAAQIVPVEKLGVATAIVFSGVSAASVIGVPLSSLLADIAGWRSAFTAISLLSLLTASILFWTLPRLAAPVSVRLTLYYGIFKKPVLLALYAATACIISAHFAAFTYLEPLLIKTQSVPPASISALLLASGLSGLMGNIIAGKLIDRYIKALIITSLILSAVALGALGVGSAAPHSLWLTGMLLAIWGASMAVIFVGLQTWLLRCAGDGAQPASAIYVAIFNAAIGTGALVGGHVIAVTGLQSIALFAAGTLLCSIIIVSMLKKPAH